MFKSKNQSLVCIGALLLLSFLQVSHCEWSIPEDDIKKLVALPREDWALLEIMLDNYAWYTNKFAEPRNKALEYWQKLKPIPEDTVKAAEIKQARVQHLYDICGHVNKIIGYIALPEVSNWHPVKHFVSSYN